VRLLQAQDAVFILTRSFSRPDASRLPLAFQELQLQLLEHERVEIKDKSLR
jgi:hypothetical protein